MLLSQTTYNEKYKAFFNTLLDLGNCLRESYPSHEGAQPSGLF
jgi:hypothetical protein